MMAIEGYSVAVCIRDWLAIVFKVYYLLLYGNYYLIVNNKEEVTLYQICKYDLNYESCELRLKSQ